MQEVKDVIIGKEGKINIYDYDIAITMKILSLLCKEAIAELSLYISNKRKKLCHITLGTIQKDLTEIAFQNKIRELENKLTEEGYGEYRFKNAEKMMNLYSKKCC